MNIMQIKIILYNFHHIVQDSSTNTYLKELKFPKLKFSNELHSPKVKT